ncbi:DUF2185 domain-containing protein [Agrococcus sp. GCM10030265]
MASYPTFIPGAGASIATNNVMTGAGKVRWLSREASQDPVDNGWRVLSDIDTDDYLANPDNSRVVDFNELCAIEPALIPIWDFPVGSQLRIDRPGSGGIAIVDEATGRALTREQLYR